jgi:hypothetical protein
MRLTTARTSDPAARQRKRLHAPLAKASSGIARMIEAFGESAGFRRPRRVHAASAETRRRRGF